MAKNCGDIPMVKLGNKIHVTESGTKCICGTTYQYGTIDRKGKSVNIIWRTPNAITCEKCKELYLKIIKDVI